VHTVGAEATADEIATFASAGGVPLNVSVAVGVDGKAHLTFKSDKRVPIAVRPAFVARPLTGITMGESASEKLPTEVRWEPFNPALPSHAALLTTDISTILNAQYPK
jgi:hypothetical protein